MMLILIVHFPPKPDSSHFDDPSTKAVLQPVFNDASFRFQPVRPSVGSQYNCNSFTLQLHLNPSSPIPPNTHNTHRKPNPTDQTPDPLHPPLARHIQLNHLPIHIVGLVYDVDIAITTTTTAAGTTFAAAAEARKAREPISPVLDALTRSTGDEGGVE